MQKEEDSGKNSPQDRNEEILPEEKQREMKSRGAGRSKLEILTYIAIGVVVLVVIYLISRQSNQTFLINK
jgi:hypothetical protein